MNQPNNQELINYILDSIINSNSWKPFLFEVSIYIGYMIGTKNEMFQKLILQNKAYLFGRSITVETRLKSFKDSMCPNLSKNHYT